MPKRRLLQFACAIAANPWVFYLKTRKIYQGHAKGLCFPGLNCYACPFALLSCPIGSIQHSFSLFHRGLDFFQKAFYSLIYTGGVVILIGMITGRLVCGWVCPIGLIQDILHKIPAPKIRLPEKMKVLKYLTLTFLVFILPLLTGVHWFSRLCPAGSLQGAVPLLIFKPASGMPRLGPFFWFKISILALVVIWMILTSRPFCRTLCPLGAIYGLFNGISLYRLEVSREKCTGCGKCVTVCPVEINVKDNANSPECVRCLECKKACDSGAIKSGFNPTFSKEYRKSKRYSS